MSRMIFVVLLLLLMSAARADQASAESVIGTRIVVGDFAIDATEVTVGQIRQWLKPAEKTSKAERDGGGHEYQAGWQRRPGWYWYSPYGQGVAADAEPAVHLTWFEAQDYCRLVGGRLPSFDEWRLAAYTELRDAPTDGYIRGRRYEYPVGDEPTGMNTAADDGWPRHALAGTTRRGVNGLFEMGANVWEWLADSSADRALTAGGSWWYGAAKTREQGAQYKPRAFAAVYIGFRCAYDVSR